MFPIVSVYGPLLVMYINTLTIYILVVPLGRDFSWMLLLLCSYKICLLCFSVKPAIFDLFLAVGILTYLAAVYMLVQVRIASNITHQLACENIVNILSNFF